MATKNPMGTLDTILGLDESFNKTDFIQCWECKGRMERVSTKDWLVQGPYGMGYEPASKRIDKAYQCTNQGCRSIEVKWKNQGTRPTPP
jgi:hypothetical protein